MNIVFICMLLVTYQLCALFEYDRAVDAAQKNRWQDAVSMFKQLVTEKPNNPALLYDTGVAAFNNEDYHQAKAYFQSAAQQDTISKQLKAQAYFNKGNAHVKLQEFKEALLSYEQALMVQPEDERAKHNHQIVKKMLEQQERQQQEQKEQEQNRQQDQSQQQEKQKQDQQQPQQSQKQDEQSSCNNKDDKSSQEDNNDSKESSSNEQKEQCDQESSQHDGFDKNGDKQDEKQDGPDEKENQSDQHNDREEGDVSNQGSQKHEQDKQQQQDSHIGPQEQQGEQQEVPQQHMQASQKEQDEAGVQQEQEVSLDPRLQQVLEKRGQRDAQLNKQLIRTSVRQEMKGEYGQNCW